MPLFFLATVEPVRKECYEEPEAAYLHTIPQRIELCNKHGTRQLGFKPAILDHAGFGEKEDDPLLFDVPKEAEIGRALDTFMRVDGQLLMSVEIFHEYPDIADRIYTDMTERGIRWGVSLGKDLFMPPDRPDIIRKEISHIGITQFPAGGGAHEQGATWINLLSKNQDDFYGMLEKLFKKEPSIYMHPQTRERLDRLFVKATEARKKNPTDTETDRAQPLSPETDTTMTQGSGDSVTVAEKNQPMAAAANPTTPPVPVQQQQPPSDPMPGVLSTAQGGNRLQERIDQFKEYYQRVADLNKAIMPDANMKNPIIMPNTWKTASALKEEWRDLVEGISFNDVPDDAINARNLVTDYLNYISRTVGESDSLSDDPELAKIQREALKDPFKLNNLATGLTVVSNFVKGNKNADVWQENFAKQRSAWKEEETKLKTEREELLKKLEEKSSALLAAATAVPGATAAGLAVPPKTQTPTPTPTPELVGTSVVSSAGPTPSMIGNKPVKFVSFEGKFAKLNDQWAPTTVYGNQTPRMVEQTKDLANTFGNLSRFENGMNSFAARSKLFK